MTEARWLACTEPDRMLRFLLGRPATGWQRFLRWLDGHPRPAIPARVHGVSDRKLRLYAAACCRLIWDLLRDGRSRYAVEVSERYADGTADEEELAAARQIAWEAIDAGHPTAAEQYITAACGASVRANLWYWAARAAGATTVPDAAEAAQQADAAVARTGVEWAAGVAGQGKRIADAIGSKTRAHMIRDVFGNPLHPRGVDLPTQAHASIDLAQTIYDQRAFSRLPELGQVLEELGCSDTEVLRHCRSSRPHALGCWVVDRILGKG